MSSYDAHPGANISTLKELWAKSAKHYRHIVDHGRADTQAFAFGRAFHCLTIEPDAFTYRYVVTENIDGRTKAGKEQIAALADDPRERLSRSFYESAREMAHAARNHPIAKRYLLDVVPELPVYWTDEETGILCKGRLDGISNDGQIIVGLKSVADITQRKTMAMAARYGYHLQWAYYFDGLTACSLYPFYPRSPPKLPLVEILVEKQPPFDVVVWEIHEDTIDVGRQEYREALVKLLECREAKNFPGIAELETVVFRLPEWAQQHDDDISDLGLES